MPVNPNLFLEKRDEVARVFNAVKNRRRAALLQLLAQRTSSLTELQRGMRNLGFDHSQTTTLGYLGPLLDAGLVQAVGERYLLTNRGWAVGQALARKEMEAALPANSNCDEEFLLMALETDDGSYGKLLGPRPAADLGRTARRLENFDFLSRERPASRAVYWKSDVEPATDLSVTERRVHEFIPEQGATVHDLSKKASISIRRTFKYLRMLREKGLVHTRKSTVKLVLTPKGRAYASLLGDLARVLESPVGTRPASPGPLGLSATALKGATETCRPGMLDRACRSDSMLGGGKPPCDLLEPLSLPGLSGQKLYHCGRHNLTIGENAGICEACDY